MDPPKARPARSRGGPTRRRLPSRPLRPREPGGPPRADRHSRPGWPSRYRNASDSQVEQNATALLLQEPQAIGQLFSAVATRRPENVARQTFRVRTDQNRTAVVDRSQGECHMFFVIRSAVDEHLEGAVTGREVRFGNPASN